MINRLRLKQCFSSDRNTTYVLGCTTVSISKISWAKEVQLRWFKMLWKAKSNIYNFHEGSLVWFDLNQKLTPFQQWHAKQCQTSTTIFFLSCKVWQNVQKKIWTLETYLKLPTTIFLSIYLYKYLLELTWMDKKLVFISYSQTFN